MYRVIQYFIYYLYLITNIQNDKLICTYMVTDFQRVNKITNYIAIQV